MSFRSLARTAVGFMWLAHILTLSLLDGRPAGSLLSNVLQLAVVLLAAVTCWVVARQTTEFAKQAAILAGASCFFWAIGQLGYLYYENILHAPIPAFSVTDVMFFGFYVSLASILFLLPAAEGRRDWIHALDFGQVAILLGSIYVYFFVFLASRSVHRGEFLRLGSINVWDLLNLILIGLFAYRCASSRHAAVRRVFLAIASLLALYGFGDWWNVALQGKTGSWMDLAYTIPFGLATILASTWKSLPETWAQPSSARKVTWWGSLFPAVPPLLVLMMAAHMQRRFPMAALLVVAASFACLALRLALTQNRQEQSAHKLRGVTEANLALSQSLELDVVLNTLLEHLHRLVPFDTANVMLREGEELVVRATRGYERWTKTEIRGTRFQLSQIFLWEDLRNGRSMMIRDTHADARWIVKEETNYVHNWLAVPLQAGGKMIGFYSLDKSVPGFFTEEHALLAAALAGQAAVAIQNAQLFEARALSEQARSRTEEKFSRAFTSHPNPMVISRLSDGKILEVNQSYFQFFGYAREEAVGRTAFELNSYADEQDRSRLVKKMVAEGRLFGEEVRLRTRSGEIRRALVSADFLDVDGEKCILGVIHDVTERRKAEEALKASEERFMKAFRASPVAMGIIAVEDGMYVDINEVFTRMTGYSREEIIGHTSADLGLWLHPERRVEMVKVLKAQGHLRDWQLELRIKGGEIRNALLSAEILDLDGKAHLVGALLDVTENRQLEEQLRQAQKMEAVGRLAGGVAHDFNNLLMVIIGRCDLALTKLGEKEPATASVEEAQRAAWKAASLTRQLLAFSRKQVLQPQVLNLNTLAANLQKLLVRMIGEDITLAFRPAADLGRVKADPGGIEQILMNLGVNARDAMPHGGRLTIETANANLDESYVMRHGVVTPGRYVLLSVSDTGVGMDAATQARVFEPFFTTKEQGKGTGLGLSTVYGIVKQSGGFIWVYSEPGHGATFKVYLPRVDAPTEEESEKEEALAISRGAETLLLVEDDPQVRELSSEFLRGAGYEVLVSADGKEALKLAAGYAGEIRMVVTDVIMPALGGREMVKQLKGNRPRMKVIYLSGYADEAVSSHGELPHGDAFLQKPFRMSDLANKIREVLDG